MGMVARMGENAIEFQGVDNSVDFVDGGTIHRGV